MKMSKKLLCMLLSCLMLFSSLAVGVSAYDDYRTPHHINSLGKPVYTYDQYCSAIADFLDVMLYEADINEKIDLRIYSAQLDLRSIDQAFDSITDFLDSTLIKIALGLGVAGDLNKLDADAIESVRRSKNKDKDVIYALLQFLDDNRGPVSNIVNDSFGWGLIDNFMDEDEYPYLFNTAQFLRETIYKLIEEKVLGNTVTTVPSSFNLDEEVQKVVDHFIVGVQKTDGTYTGFLPSMAGKTDVYNQRAYDFIQSLLDAAIADMIVPKLMEMLPDVLNIETRSDAPNGDPEHPGLLPTIVGVVNDYLHLGYDYDDEQEPIVELHKLLTWLLVGTNTNVNGVVTHNPAAIYEIIQFTDHGVDIKDSIIDDVKTVLRTLGPGLVGQFMEEYFPDGVEAPEGIENYDTDQIVSYFFNLLIPKLLPGVRILPGCDTVRECLTYTAIYFAIDIVPEFDYYGQIESGALDPEGDAWIEIAAKIGAYYVKNVVDAEDASIDTVEFANTVSFDTLIGKLADWAIANYGFLANTRQNFSGMSPWQKIDSILFGILDPTMMTINLNSPSYSKYSYYSEALIKGCILEGLANLDIEQILGFVGRRAATDTGAIFNGSVITVIVTLVKKILSALMNGNEVVPSGVRNIEGLLEKNNLGTLISNLFHYLYTERDYNFNTVIPLVAGIMGLNDSRRAKLYAPETDPTRSMADLINLVNTLVPDNGDLKYNDDNYFTFGSEDFTEYYKFDDFKDTLKEVRALIEKYEENPTSVSQIDINDNYYRLNTYWSRLVYKTNTTSKKICKTQLVREISYAAANIPSENYSTATEGKIYTDRSWRLYTEALAFANKVNNTSDVHQSKISLARGELFKAIDALKAYKPLANYRALDTLISRAEAIDPATYSRYTTDSMSVFKTALAAAKNLDRDYDQDDQSIVNHAASTLSSALNGLVVWEINYELGADIQIAPSVAQDSTTVLKFREGTGATVVDVTATVDNGATISAPYTEGDYTCWTINPSNSPLYTIVTATINFTQPDTGRNYTARAYTFVDSANYAITFNVNTCLVGKARNVYNVYVNGIKSADTRTVNFAQDYNSGSATCTTVPTGTVFVDVSQGYTNLSQIPGLGVTFRKNADTYGSNYAGGGTHSFSAVEVSSLTSSNSAIGLTESSLSFDVNTTQAETVGFTGAIPAVGGSITTTVTSTMKATSTAGGTDTSVLSFNLRVNAYNKAALRAAVNDAIASCRQEWFYSSGWDIYTRDLVRAVTVLNNPVVTQAEIDEATANLIEAADVLEFKSADLVDLYKAISLADSIDPHNYKSLKAINDIIAEINASDLSRGILDQALVNDFTERLLEAIDSLEPAESTIYIRCFDSSTATEVEGEMVGYTLISSDTVIGDVGDKIRIDIPEVIGYAPDEGQEKKSFTVTYEDNYIDFYYSPLTYNVTLNPQGGQLDNRTVTVTYGRTYDNLPVPTRNGFVFNGWYTKASGGYLVDETTRVTTGHYISLYAHWSIATSTGESIDDMSMTDIIKTGDTMSFIQKLQSWMVNIWNFILGLFK